MAFPASPSDNQTYLKENGQWYKYSLANKAWYKIADPALLAANIKNAVSIGGVTGNYDYEASNPIAVATVLSGKVGFVNGSKVNGTMTNKVGSATIITPSTADQTIPQGYYGGAAGDGKVLGDTDLAAANIKHAINIFGVVGTYDDEGTNPITAGDVVSPHIGFVNGAKITGTVTEKIGSNTVITPSTADQAFPAGRYGGATTDGKCAGDADLVVGNIKYNVNIFGVVGSYDYEATNPIAAATVLSGKIGFVNGAKVTGTMTNVGAQSITPAAAGNTITAGYHNGSGGVAADADFIAGNIKTGVNIWGVTGTYAGASLEALSQVQDGVFNGQPFYIKYWKMGKVYFIYADASAGSYGRAPIYDSGSGVYTRLATLFGVTVSSWLTAPTYDNCAMFIYNAPWSRSLNLTNQVILGFVAA